MRKRIAFDFETHLIAPGLRAPKIVCGVITDLDTQQTDVYNRRDIIPLLRKELESDTLLIGHNVAFDLICLCANEPSLIEIIFKAYSEDRISDTMYRQQLIDLETDMFSINNAGVRKGDTEKGYSLAACVYRNLGVTLAKEDTWRLRYAELDGFEVKDYPADALEYVANDGKTTAALYLVQDRAKAKSLVDEFRQARRFFALSLSACYGINIDQKKVDLVEDFYDQEYDKLLEVLTKPVTVKVAATWDEEDDQELLIILEAIDQKQARSKRHTKVLQDLEETADELRARFKASSVGYREKKFTLVRKDGSRDTKAAKEFAEGCMFSAGKEIVATAGGDVSLSKEAVAYYDDDTLTAYAEFSSFKKKRSTDIKLLRSGADGPIAPFYMMAATGRTRTRPNTQNWPAKSGMRECVVPRPGHVFFQADWEGLELRTLAQTCVWLFGFSKLADAMNEGKDPHCVAASTILGLSYEQTIEMKKAGDPALKIARDTAKQLNFGCGGGLGVSSLVRTIKRGCGWTDADIAAQWSGPLPYDRMMLEDVEWKRRNFATEFPTEDQIKAWARCDELKRMWLETWPEMSLYFSYVRNNLTREKHYKTKKGEEYEKDVGDFKHFYSGRIRSGIPFTEFCNTPFQGLGADVAGEVSWRLARACYSERESPLYGCSIINFVHDEYIGEAPEHRAHEAALELSQIMCETAKEIMPDVPHAAPPLLMKYWSKSAHEIIDEETGRLIPWPE